VNNIIFLTENLSPNSHTIDLLDGIHSLYHDPIIINYFETYCEHGKSGLERLISKQIESSAIDMILINLGTTCIIDPEFICLISNKYGIKIVVIFPDPEHNFEDHDRYYAQCADICWLFANATEYLFNLYGYKTFIGQGFSIIRYPLINAEKKIPVSFIGGIDRADRKKYISFLNEHGISIELAGHGTKRGLVSVEEKNKIISSSHIHLNFTKVENKRLKIFQRVRQQKGRIIESLLLGTFVLTEYCPGLRDIFSDSELDIFNSPEELLFKINYYFKNPQIISDMAARGHKKALYYESSVVFKRLTECVNCTSIMDKKFIGDSQFNIKYISSRYYFFSRFIFIFKFKQAFSELYSIIGSKSISAKNVLFDIPRGFKHALLKK
jgi:hypothetical protein